MFYKRTIAFLALFLLCGGVALAQTPGGVRIQGRTGPAEDAPQAGPTGQILDFREQMRLFVQNISDYARKLRPAFIIIAQNGLELLVKQDLSDPDKTAPANTYIRSIDGVLQEGLFFGLGKPPSKDKRESMHKLTEQAKKSGLNVLVVDYAKDPKTVDESHRLNAAKGFISFAAHEEIPFLNSLPPYPKRPFTENQYSILSLKDVRNFLVLEDTAAFGTQPEFALKMHDNNYDMLIVDIFHGRQPLSKRAVETLKYKKVGGRRLVIAHINIGSAASYHYYWKPYWREGVPFWISTPHRDDPDKYNVQYWQPAWQKVIFGDTQSYIYGLIDQGYDGVLLNGVDAFIFSEGSGEEEE